MTYVGKFFTPMRAQFSDRVFCLQILFFLLQLCCEIFISICWVSEFYDSFLEFSARSKKSKSEVLLVSMMMIEGKNAL